VNEEGRPWRRKPGRKPLNLQEHPFESKAIVFLLRYEGDFPFLLDLKAKIGRKGWRLTRKQVDAVLRCAARVSR
jgi:hypothetical protein